MQDSEHGPNVQSNAKIVKTKDGVCDELHEWRKQNLKSLSE